ncbi:MAG: cyclophilin-like fold protein [Tractidigestivibacter sp.]|uniref:cyclophilin-like fold protein n=1 Tax=Tractidigestivibacter sp. TaxID=2847320 RepID=UPI003D93A30F
MADKIRLKFGDADVLAQLNDTETAHAFSSHLPLTVHVSGTGVDFCGRMPFSLPYEQEQVHNGWTNGDVNYNPGGGWLAVLYDGEKGSERYGDQVVMGKIVPEDLPRMQELSGGYDLVIERVEGE